MSGLGGRRHDRDGLLEDIKILKRRRLPAYEIADRLGISRATLYRILNEAKR